MNVLAIGDVFGEAGKRAVAQWLPRLREEHDAAFVIVNVENVKAGRGVDASGVRAILEAGADCLTSGNHVWAQKGHDQLLQRESHLLRPYNYPDPCPGRGFLVAPSTAGPRIAVLNLQGRVFMPPIDDPFRAADRALEQLRGHADAILVDMHAEASSEKLALATYLDGRVAAVFGTHTHVQTADARILPGGTAFITDLGMTGPYGGVIGMQRESALRRFLTARPGHADPSDAEPGLRGAVFEIDEGSGRAIGVRRIARGAGGA
jgi:hypothetical protein